MSSQDDRPAEFITDGKDRWKPDRLLVAFYLENNEDSYHESLCKMGPFFRARTDVLHVMGLLPL